MSFIKIAEETPRLFNKSFTWSILKSKYFTSVGVHSLLRSNSTALISESILEGINAISGLAGIDFRPRLASIHKKQLYSINAVYN